MALLLLKTLVFPQSRHAGYNAVATRSPVDCERGSTDLSLSSDDDGDYKEKAASASPSLPPKDSSTAASKKSAFRINPRTISDATIGLSDGLTVPFALTAGLSALGDTHVVIYGGLAELIAGGISMGLGGYLGAKSETEAYHAALCETRSIVQTDGERASGMVREAFANYDFSEQTLACMTTTLAADPERMVEFLMRFYHLMGDAAGAQEGGSGEVGVMSRAYVSGFTISMGYLLGGLIPLVPYLFCTDMRNAFFTSVVVMGLALFLFGWAKTALIGECDRWVCFKSGVQMMMLGGVAAGAAMGCVKAVGS
ncbi:VIT family-domain-containing protein [Neohortaea acidophila]|uniref:VIT family-domain-containing protein n=1 Tax=Neohortaea acidophila TaxID=245834 RepID=A0A6A6PVX8_9PEZI|nr:VIT family-domain-containing protein [Neohortaea acidophila]KAF2483894.1 VIT family-domain-containing protein [Neohortaea acidophila]